VAYTLVIKELAQTAVIAAELVV